MTAMLPLHRGTPRVAYGSIGGMPIQTFHSIFLNSWAKERAGNYGQVEALLNAVKDIQ